MKRVALLCLLASSLSACQTVAEAQRQASANEAAKDAKCRYYAGVPGRPEYANCRIALDRIEQQSAAQKSAEDDANSRLILAAVAGGLAGVYAAKADAHAAAVANRPLNCTALQTGNITTTRCN